MRRWLTVLACAAGSATGLHAFEMSLPDGARLVADHVAAPDSYDLPIAPFSEGALPVLTLEGQVVTRAWRLDQSGLTSLQFLRTVETQLTAAGFETRFSCADHECGGFDFRFNTRVLPAPEMYVDLFDYRFLTARNPEGQAVSVLVSRSDIGVLFLQMIHVSPDGAAPVPVVSTPDEDTTTVVIAIGTVVGDLRANGHVILGDLEFKTGSSALSAGPYASLQALARFLSEDPARRVVLVGHTDLVGSLADNVRLSKARADAVRTRLIEGHGVPAAQLDAEGVGYLSPISPNSTPAGRDVNRRVEAVLLNTP